MVTVSHLAKKAVSYNLLYKDRDPTDKEVYLLDSVIKRIFKLGDEDCSDRRGAMFQLLGYQVAPGIQLSIVPASVVEGNTAACLTLEDNIDILEAEKIKAEIEKGIGVKLIPVGG
ncbi:MAG: hypothetical protein ABIE22_03960 [archaeon]